MADFILHREIIKTIPVEPYPFPNGAFQIYGNGRFYNGFSIGDRNNLSVVNRDGVLKFSRGASNAQEETAVILGTIPENTKESIIINIASPLSQNMTAAFKIDNMNLPNNDPWTRKTITNADVRYKSMVQAGGVLSIYFKSTTALPAIRNLLELQAIWIN